MAVREESVKLDRILEYLIFSNSLASISKINSEEHHALFRISDVGTDSFLAEPLDASVGVNFLHKCNDAELIFKAGFKNKAITFSTRILSTIDGGFNFSMPAVAQLTDLRKYPRSKLRTSTSGLQIELEIETHMGRKVFSTATMIEISQKAMSLYLNRDEGLVLPGETVAKIKIYSQGKLTLETSGQVLRVDKNKKSQDGGRTYFCVIEFDRNEISNQPAAKDSGEKRSLDRVLIFEQVGNLVQFNHPIFSDVVLSGQVVDISTSGLSILIEKTNLPVLRGMMLNDLILQLNKKDVFKTQFKVLRVQEANQGDGTTFRIGGQFMSMNVELLKCLSKTIQASIDQNLVDANSQDYEHLWEFFFQTGFIYTKKRKQIQELAPKLFKTYSKLLEKENGLVKKILYKEQDEIKGHLSAIRYFDKSWLVQHLNALRTSNNKLGAQLVLQAVVAFLRDERSNRMIDIKYCLAFYRPDNIYSNMVFSHVKKLINDPKICNYSDLQFCLLKDEEEITPFSPPEVDVRIGTREDFENLETLLISQNYYDLIRTENLSAETIANLRISEEYAALDLYRYRRVLVATDKSSNLKAYAVCNYSSPGLNLSELTNSFRIFYDKPEAKENLKLAGALTSSVLDSYQKTEMPSPVLLVEPGQIVPFQFSVSKVYRYWFLDAAHLKKFKEATEEIYKNLRPLLKMYSQEANQDKEEKSVA